RVAGRVAARPHVDDRRAEEGERHGHAEDEQHRDGDDEQCEHHAATSAASSTSVNIGPTTAIRTDWMTERIAREERPTRKGSETHDIGIRSTADLRIPCESIRAIASTTSMIAIAATMSIAPDCTMRTKSRLRAASTISRVMCPRIVMRRPAAEKVSQT